MGNLELRSSSSFAVVDIVESAGSQLVYQSNESSPIVISKRSHPANTNPLVFKRTCLFRFENQESCNAAMEPGVLSQLKEVAGELSVQLYQRVARSKALPAFGKLFREKIAPKDPNDVSDD